MAKPQKWDRHAILGELRRRGMTLTRLAELNNVSPGGFRTIWTRPNSNSESIIAAFLEVPVETLFPDRYPKSRSTVLAPEFLDAKTKAAA
ncbi:putative transcriptional regulator, Nlp [Rhizobium sp. PDO1-076]|uniref:helix-turn-helix domain-containing protein n=1 Tax=Rhizobium sp. PDO1-076 TaxID=1125979 RepID=UPI00024E35E3|nr:helix-turn-helix domain-containing protein [Rhizobium sp. PDO1-076]EHS51531.1 putative transcriptional regulator, Nlp [Rhizobium sp. PDO1-076]